MVVELDPDKRNWEYDGNGAKIYKYDPKFPIKRRYSDTDLDGGRPMPKDWIKESDRATISLNDWKNDVGDKE